MKCFVRVYELKFFHLQLSLDWAHIPCFLVFNVFSMSCRLSVQSGLSFAAVVLWCHRSDDEPERRSSVSLAWGGLNTALWALSIFLFASIIASLSHTHTNRFALQTFGFVIKSTVPEGHCCVWLYLCIL